MSVLSSLDIQRSLGYGGLDATRENGKQLSVEPASMDVHLGESLKVTNHDNNDGVVKVDDESTYPEYREIETVRPRIPAGEFMLATTEETITVPKGMVALLHGRSSVGRLGLFIENAGLIDPGFNGQVTLELTNAEDYDIELVPGMKIGQLTFHQMHTAPNIGYSTGNGNKYIDQAGATPSRLYEDFE